MDNMMAVSSNSRLRLIVAGIVMLALVTVSILTPVTSAKAHEGSYQEYMPSTCGYWGKVVHIGESGVGTSKGQTTYDEGPCSAVKTRLRYLTPGGSCVTVTWNSQQTGQFPAMSISMDSKNAQWVDANVLVDYGYWAGFKLTHASSCWH